MKYEEIEKTNDELINNITLKLENESDIVLDRGMVISIDKTDDDFMTFEMHCCNLSGREFENSIEGMIGLIVNTIGARAAMGLVKYFSDSSKSSDLKISGTKFDTEVFEN